MSNYHHNLNFFIQMAKAQAVLARRFDGRLGVLHGIGLNDLVILHHLSLAPHERIRRIDLAQLVGLTASGVTRMLLPMEKIGLIKRETNPQDARVSYVALASGGKRLLTDAIETAKILSDDLIDGAKVKKIDAMSEVLESLGKMSL